MRAIGIAARTLAMTCASGMLLGTVTAQTLKPLRAEWADLETWSRYIEATRETESGLGLQVAGSTGTTFVAFIGRLAVRDPSIPPREVTLQVGIGKLSNPNIVRRPTLMLIADARLRTPRAEFRLSPPVVVDDPAPGALVENGVATLRAVDFARLCAAETLSGEVFGFEVVFRADQIAAMRAQAERLHISKPSG